MSLFCFPILFIECPYGEPVTINFDDKDEIDVGVMGPSEESVEPDDVLLGSGKKLKLTFKDVLLIKEICPYDLTLILSISFSVTNASSVNIIFLGSAGDVITNKEVSTKDISF